MYQGRECDNYRDHHFSLTRLGHYTTAMACYRRVNDKYLANSMYV